MAEHTEVSPGVLRHVEYGHAVYIGAADALIAAGLVRLDQLPGQPGNGRGMCTFDADGTKVQKGRPTGRGPGRKYIIAKKSAAGCVYEIRLRLSPERVEAIEAERVRAASCWPFPVVHGTAFMGALAPEVRA